MSRSRRVRRRLGLGALFVLLGLLVFVISGVGLVVFRIYDNQLVRQTESELIAQATLVSAIFEQELVRRLGEPGIQQAGHPLENALRHPDASSPLRPIPPRLSLGTDQVRAPAEAPLPTAAEPDAEVLAAGLAVMPVLTHAKRTTLAGIRVVDAAGTVVASSALELKQSLAHREEVRRALLGEHVSLLRRRISDEPPPAYGSLSRETGVRVFVAEPVIHGDRVLGAVVLSRTPMTLGKAFYQDRFSLLTTAGILVAAVLAVSLLASALVVRPIRALIRQTEAISAGSGPGTDPIEHPGTREIAQLSDAFARMSTRLGERAEYIKGFAASVSHEFKTPLSAIRGTVELLHDHGAVMDTAERERFLSNLSGDADRLERLVRRVLELARADMLEPGRDTTRLRPVLEQVAERFRAGGMQVHLSVPDDAIRMAPETLDAVVSSLLDNARQYAGQAATVLIVAHRAAPPLPAIILLEVRDDGPGISDANAARIFEPFFTTSRDRGGTGMGLTIVRALLHAHGGTIELAEAKPNACFRLHLPAG